MNGFLVHLTAPAKTEVPSTWCVINTFTHWGPTQATRALCATHHQLYHSFPAALIVDCVWVYGCDSIAECVLVFNHMAQRWCVRSCRLPPRWALRRWRSWWAWASAGSTPSMKKHSSWKKVSDRWWGVHVGQFIAWQMERWEEEKCEFRLDNGTVSYTGKWIFEIQSTDNGIYCNDRGRRSD